MMDKASRMYALLDREATSGKIIKDFCVEAGLSYATFHYWRRRRRASATPSPTSQASDGFITLNCSTPQHSTAATLTVELPGGLQLKLIGGDLDRLADLLARLDRRYAEF